MCIRDRARIAAETPDVTDPRTVVVGTVTVPFTVALPALKL